LCFATLFYRVYDAVSIPSYFRTSKKNRPYYFDVKENKMTKYLSNVLACIFLFGLIGCGSVPDIKDQATVTQDEPNYIEIPFNELFSNFRSNKRKELPDYFVVNCKIQITAHSGPNESGLFLENVGLVPVLLLGFVDIEEHKKGVAGGYFTYNILLLSNALQKENDDLVIIDSYGLVKLGVATRIEPEKNYNVFIKKERAGTYSDNYYLYIEKIDGLLSVEDVKNLRAVQVAEQEAAVEIRRAAQEEADRYDPNDFILVFPEFRKSLHETIDLFDAVVTIEKGKQLTDFYFSDVIFVSQDGMTIDFTTDDHAITQRMKIFSRSGLTANQKVRVYYTDNFEVMAIEKR
jgi:hypothetical protein